MRIGLALFLLYFSVGVQPIFSSIPREILGQSALKVDEGGSIEVLPSKFFTEKPKQIRIVLPEVGFSPEVGVLSSGETLPEVGMLTFDVTYDQDGLPSGSYDFPKKGRLVGTGNVIIFSGKFELKKGLLSYSGEGIVGPILIKISLTSLDYLTSDEKEQVDKELNQARELQEKRVRFLQFLEEREKEVWVERLKEEEDLYAQDRWEVEKVEVGPDSSSWDDLEKFALLRMWHQFEDVDIEPEPVDVENQEGWIRVKSAAFLMTPTTGTIDFTVGEQHVFKLPQAELVCNYREDPYITSPITLLNQQAELRVTERQLKASIKIENGLVADVLPQLDIILPKKELPFARFDGALHISVADGVAFEGRIFDARTKAAFAFDLAPGVPVAFDFLRLAIKPGKESALQAAATVFGVPVELFATIDKQEGFLARMVLQPAPIRRYLPFLPARDFDTLFFSGKVEWSREDGFSLRGKLHQENTDLLPLWGLVFNHGAIDFNFSNMQGRIFGEFNVFDLKARGVFNMILGKDPQVSFAAELVDTNIEAWEPASLESFLKGAESQVAPFKFKKLRLIGGVETVDSPVKTLQEALHKKNKKDASSVEKEVSQDDKNNSKDSVNKKSENKREEITVLTTTKYVPERDLRFFCAVVGEAIILNELCFAAVKVHQDSKGLGLLLVAEPSGEWSLAKGLPKIFAHNPQDKPAVEYLKNIVGGASLSNLSFVVSSFKDIETGVERGVNVLGMVAYQGALEENPLFRPFLAQSHKSPVYLKRDGRRGVGITVGMVINPIDFQNTVLRLGVSTGDVGIFFRAPHMDEIGFKELAGEVLFYPFAIMGAGKVTLMYKGGTAVRPMKVGAEITADKVGMGGVVSGVGDVDFGKFLPLFFGKDLAAAINQTAIFRDWGLEFQTTWVAIGSVIGAIGSAVPTMGIGTLIGFISFILSSIDTFGLSGGIEIGQGYDPLVAQFAVKGGWDLTTLIFEILYEKPGGFFSMAMFLADVYSQLITLGTIKKVVPDMRKVQTVLEQFFPLDLEKFYLKFVPLGTRLGEITMPFGVGGSLYLTLFGKTIGADIMLDSNGAYGVGLVDPIDWGVYKLLPSKTIGQVAKKLEDTYREWGLLSFAPEQDHEKKIRLEASAHLEKGFSIITDFDLMLADMVGGSIRAILSLQKGLDLQGHVEFKIPGLVEQLGIPSGSAQLWVKGWQLNFDNPMAMLYQGDPKNIALEVGFTNTVNQAIQQVVRGTLGRAKESIEATVNALLSNVLQKAHADELVALQQKRDEICNDTGLFGITKDIPGCAAAELALRSTQARNTLFETVDKAGLGAIPELVRQGITTISKFGVGGLQGGRFVFDKISSIFELRKIWWRGSVVDVAEGRIPAFIVDAVILGNHITGEVGGIDLKDPLKGVRKIIDDMTKLVVKELMTILQLPQPEIFAFESITV